MPFTVVHHPLIAHRLTELRDEETPPETFRRLAAEITQLVAFEATRDLAIESMKVVTPLEATMGSRLLADGPIIVPILRAGLGMLEPLTTMIPNATVGLVGLRRNEETFEAESYCITLPQDLAGRQAIICDPMLATGGSMVQTYIELRQRGVSSVKGICLVAAPEGVRRLEEEAPDVAVFAAALDDRLNETAYIVPGLGDAGDRLFGPNS